jgi:hypothetical protein
MRQLYLAFDGRASRTYCAFFSEAEVTAFARWTFGITDAGKHIPVVYPTHDPIPFFDTAAEAIAHFKEKVK